MALRSDRLDAIVSLSKRRGFVYPSSEIYGGLRAAWDYGPLGVELKNNIKREWWRSMVTGRDDIVGLDSSVILAREVWEASGHVTEFTDPLTECSFCRYSPIRCGTSVRASESPWMVPRTARPLSSALMFRLARVPAGAPPAITTVPVMASESSALARTSG